MALDTNAKKFKYSLTFKILCVVLCCVTALSACVLTAGLIPAGVKKYDGDSFTDWTETSDFRYRLSDTVIGVVGTSLFTPGTTFYNEQMKSVDAELKNTAESDAVDSVYNDIMRAVEEWKIDSETFYLEDLNFLEDPCATVTLKNYGDYTYVFEYGGKLKLSQLKAIISKDYEEYFIPSVKNSVENNYSSNYNIDFADELSFSLEIDNKVVDKNADINAESIKKKDTYFVISDGKIQDSKGISPNTLEGIVKSDKNLFNTSGYTLYVYIDTEGNNWYARYLDLFNAVDKISQMFYILCAVDLLCIVASFALAFCYFGITGRKEEDEPSGIWLVDRIPFEIQLGAVGGLIFGGWCLFYNVTEMLYPLELCVVTFVLFCLEVWGLVFGLCSSTARYAHSERKFYKHLLTYWVLFAIYKAFEFIFKMCKKLVLKAKANSKFFKYTPHQLGRNTVKYVILYFVGNMLAMVSNLFLYFLSVFSGVFAYIPLGILVTIGIIAANFAIIKKVVSYVKDLDMIIDASSRHTDIGADLDALPESLRVLAESMKYTNAELQQAVAKAVKDERLRTELITNVSHDLKTPLTSIITYVDLLSKCDIDDEKAKEYIAVLDEKGSKLKRLIDDLIEASKVTTGNITVNISPMNLSELCLQATVDSQADFEKAGLELIVKQGEKPVNVLADGAKAFRIIENLLSNAKKYSAKASRVYVSVYEDREWGVFEIKNISAQPLDISPDELTERFVRGDKSRNQDGNGLGLSIAKELCKAQNGILQIAIDGDLFKAKVLLPKNK